MATEEFQLTISEIGTAVPPNDSVTTAKIVDGAVTAAKLAAALSA